jgi:hypothetical protein
MYNTRKAIQSLTMEQPEVGGRGCGGQRLFLSRSGGGRGTGGGREQTEVGGGGGPCGSPSFAARNRKRDGRGGVNSSHRPLPDFSQPSSPSALYPSICNIPSVAIAPTLFISC